MQMPVAGTSWETLVNDYGVFHLSRMQAEPKTKGIAAVFQARQDALEAKGQAFNALWKAQSAAEAVLVKSDADMDNLVRELYFDKIGACGNKKNDPGLKRWFPKGLKVVREAFPDELEKVKTLIQVLADTPDDPLAASFIPRLKPMADGYAQAIASFGAAVKAAENSWKLIEAEKVNWLGAYKKDYADILSLFNGDKRMADSFFKQPPRGKKPPKPPASKA
jgi:hypothetical protein